MTCICGPHGWRDLASCYVQRFKDSAYEEEMYHQKNSCKKCCKDNLRREAERRMRDRKRRRQSEERRQRERELERERRRRQGERALERERRRRQRDRS